MLANLTSPVALWGFAAAVPAVVLEYLFRKLEGPWHQYWYVFVPAACWINYSVCQMIRQPGISLIDTLVVFAFSTMVSRVFISVVLLNDTIAPGTWAACGLILLARYIQVAWK